MSLIEWSMPARCLRALRRRAALGPRSSPDSAAGFENQCMEHGAVMVDRQVVNLGNIVTANGPASAMLFALTIVANELGNAASQQVGGGMLLFSPQENLYL